MTVPAPHLIAALREVTRELVEAETAEVAVESKFKVGDWVMVYGCGIATHRNNPSRFHLSGKAVVQMAPQDTEYIEVEFTDDTTLYTVHPKQCRRLIKKERRRVWVHPNAFSRSLFSADCDIHRVRTDRPDHLGVMLEFIEVVKKK